MKREFSELRDELVAQGRKFGEEELKQLKFGDLVLAGVANAMEARCDWKLIEAEMQRRLARFNELDFDELDRATFDDETEKIAAFRALAERKREGLEITLPVRLYKAMKALRDDWSGGRDSPHLATIYSVLEACVAANVLPNGFLLAVKDNADRFDGHFNDGRIMRDGQLLLTEELAKEFNFHKSPGDPPGFVSVSGNLARVIGASPVKKGGWYGSYEELWELLLSPREKAAALLEDEEISEK